MKRINEDYERTGTRQGRIINSIWLQPTVFRQTFRIERPSHWDFEKQLYIAAQNVKTSNALPTQQQFQLEILCGQRRRLWVPSRILP